MSQEDRVDRDGRPCVAEAGWDGQVCFCGHKIPVFGSVLWCNCCMDEIGRTKEEMGDFIARKRREAQAR